MRSPYRDALRSPLNLVVLALALAAGLCAAWWLLPIGLAVWGVMVVLHANDPALKVNYMLDERAATLSRRFQAAYDKATRSQVRLFNAIQGCRSPLKEALSEVNREVEALTNEVYDLCLRVTAPDNYYRVTTRDVDLEGQRALAILALEGTTDPAERKAKQAALEAIEGQQQQFKRIADLLDRVEQRLAEVAIALDGWLAEIVRLQLLTPQEASAQVPALVRRVKAERGKLNEFDEDLARLP